MIDHWIHFNNKQKEKNPQNADVSESIPEQASWANAWGSKVGIQPDK